MENLLNKFLQAGLLHEIGDDEQKFGFLQTAAKDLGAKLQKNKADVVRFALSGLNPDVPPTDSSLADAETLLTKNWKTLRNKYPDAPRQLLRAVILEAVSRQCENDAAVAAAIWLTSASVFPLLQFSPNEQSLLEDFLVSLRDQSEKKSEEFWRTREFQIVSPASDDLNSPEIEITALTASSKYLEEGLLKASSPQDEDGAALKDANPHNPNEGYPWGAEFAKRSTKTIKAVIDEIESKSAEEIRKGFAQIQTNYQENVSALFDSFQTVVEDLSRGKTAETMRNDLLWWRQSLYSSQLKTGYRKTEPFEAALTMAFDLHRLSARFHPASVEYLLREAFSAAFGEKAGEKISIANFASTITASKQAAFWRQSFAPLYKGWSGQLPLAAILKLKLDQTWSVAEGEPKQMLETLSESEIEISEMAVWLFRDLQAHRLVTAKDDAK
ncbi:MAG TPA: GTPase-associated system all-helical protein GASH [Pyrinomonadaceae bacterium]|nr:GTPase-associated system all-helical protein GASH [Pyrinomonadaceae bacterium]